MAIDDKYINYNLSLVDPNELDIPATPEPEKVDVEVDSAIPRERRRATYTEDYTPPEEIKEEIDLSNYVTIEDKGEADLNDAQDLTLSDALLAKNFPIVGVDSEFKSKVLISQTYDGTYGGPAWPSDIPISMEEFDVTDANKGKREGDPVEDLEQMDPNFEVRVLDQDYESEKASGLEPSQYNRVNLSALESAKDDSKDVLDFSRIDLSKVITVPYTTDELSYEDVVDRLNIKGQVSNLGAVHVYPVNPSDEGGISSKYTIPFMFNAKTTSSGVSAKFESSSILSRVGDIHSYIKTDASAITLTTRYQVLSEDKNKNRSIPDKMKGDHSRVGSWMEDFTLSNIQKIEMAYRGLVYPQTNKNVGNFYRPPVIKIVYGNSNKVSDGQSFDEAVPFNNLLTYPYIMPGGTKIYHKSFIATKVDIKKDWDMSPMILNDNNDGILDLQAFDVTLNLVEIDPMYIGILPSFEDYYSMVPTL